MYEYSFYVWVLFFYVYCFIGWCFESLVVSIDTKKLTNRGFMKGPWLPIYGSGAVAMLLAADLGHNPLQIFVIGAFLATVIEYITGEAMVRLFKVRYWDYSDRKIQLNGHICLSSTLIWGVMCLVMVYKVHPVIESFVFGLNGELLSIVVFAVTILMVYDFTKSLQTALDLREVICEIEKARKEWESFVEDKKDELEERVKEKKDEIELRVKENREEIETRLEIRKENVDRRVKERKEELEERISVLKDRLEKRSEKIARHNPGYKAIFTKKK